MMPITDRQQEIRSRLDQGLSAGDIASDLGISRNAVYQQIQRMRRDGNLPGDFTPSSAPPREFQPGERLLRSLLDSTTDRDVEAASAMALVEEIRRTRNELDRIAQRLSSIVPR